MINRFAISNYRSFLQVIAPLGPLNVVTGANGSGKSNLYKSLRLLAETAHGRVVNALAQEGGLPSALWAEPAEISRAMKRGEVPIEGSVHSTAKRLRLGFAGEDFGYAISLGMRPASPDDPTMFRLDPEIKREVIWSGDFYRPASCLVDRENRRVKIRAGRSWEVYASNIAGYDSILSEFSDPTSVPEIIRMREMIRGWRFYDHFRTDYASPIRVPQVGTYTPVLDQEGIQLAAALQTILEVGDAEGLQQAINEAFPGSYVRINNDSARFCIEFHQPGLLRPLSQAELSDGTLRYLLLVAALLTPRPPSLLVLNEPETSLHPDLIPALAKLIIKASQQTQVWVVSHASSLVSELKKSSRCYAIHLEKEWGATVIEGQAPLDAPAWHWADKG